MSFTEYFFIVYDELDFPVGMCRIKKGENEKVRHAMGEGVKVRGISSRTRRQSRAGLNWIKRGVKLTETEVK